MTKRELLISIQHAEARGNHALARVLAKTWADVLNEPDSPEARIESSPINKITWDDVRLSQDIGKDDQ